MDGYGSLMDLTGVDNAGKAQMPAKRFPGLRSSGRRWLSEEAEISRDAIAGLTSAPPGGPLDKPWEPSFPFGVRPVSHLAGSKHFGDPPGVNPGACRAYHGNELPDIDPIDPGNLSCQRKFRSF